MSGRSESVQKDPIKSSTFSKFFIVKALISPALAVHANKDWCEHFLSIRLHARWCSLSTEFGKIFAVL